LPTQGKFALAVVALDEAGNTSSIRVVTLDAAAARSTPPKAQR
jgi:hypothetical protein